MQFQADEAERLIASGITAGEIMSPVQSVEIMQTLDKVRVQIGLKYPGEEVPKLNCRETVGEYIGCP